MDRAEKILRERFPNVPGLFPDTIKDLRRMQHETRLETIGHFIDQADENGFKTGIPAVSKQWLIDVLDGEETGNAIIDWEVFEIDCMED